MRNKDDMPEVIWAKKGSTPFQGTWDDMEVAGDTRYQHVPDTHCVVPKEPTEEIKETLHDLLSGDPDGWGKTEEDWYISVYKAMIEKAGQAPISY